MSKWRQIASERLLGYLLDSWRFGLGLTQPEEAIWPDCLIFDCFWHHSKQGWKPTSAFWPISWKSLVLGLPGKGSWQLPIDCCFEYWNCWWCLTESGAGGLCFITVAQRLKLQCESGNRADLGFQKGKLSRCQSFETRSRALGGKLEASCRERPWQLRTGLAVPVCHMEPPGWRASCPWNCHWLQGLASEYSGLLH